MFWTIPLSIIRSFSLYTQQWYMSYRFADSLLYIYIYIYIYTFIHIFIYCRSCGTSLGPNYICCSIQVCIIHKTWVMTQILCIRVLKGLHNFASGIIYGVWTCCSFCVGCNINLFLMRIYVKHATCSKKKSCVNVRVLVFGVLRAGHSSSILPRGMPLRWGGMPCPPLNLK
jgi:hypothetical protein